MSDDIMAFLDAKFSKVDKNKKKQKKSKKYKNEEAKNSENPNEKIDNLNPQFDKILSKSLMKF